MPTHDVMRSPGLVGVVVWGNRPTGRQLPHIIVTGRAIPHRRNGRSDFVPLFVSSGANCARRWSASPVPVRRHSIEGHAESR